ncbi:hypothetical protein [Spirosoma sp.]|uniref:hypothetical protein n=1 Tax=Spirosoma sp. TaxID=1899569 RepID=UPI003B3AED81
MQRTTAHTNANSSGAVSYSPIQTLLSQSEDDFYGSLQRIWNSVSQLEDLGIIQQENDKFVYAYRLAEIELQRAFSTRTAGSVINTQTY